MEPILHSSLLQFVQLVLLSLVLKGPFDNQVKPKCDSEMQHKMEIPPTALDLT